MEARRAASIRDPVEEKAEKRREAILLFTSRSRRCNYMSMSGHACYLHGIYSAVSVKKKVGELCPAARDHATYRPSMYEYY